MRTALTIVAALCLTLAACGDEEESNNGTNNNGNNGASNNGNNGASNNGAYEACGGKMCGDPCTVCDPNDANCTETAVEKFCNQALICIAGEAQCI